MGLFDWVPDWGVDVYGLNINIAWVILIGFCFGVAAILDYDQCGIAQIPILGLATQMANQISGSCQ